MGYDAGCLLTTFVEEDMRRAGLSINWDVIDGIPKHERLHLWFDVELFAGLFKARIARWEALRNDAAAMLLNCKGTSV